MERFGRIKLKWHFVVLLFQLVATPFLKANQWNYSEGGSIKSLLSFQRLRQKGIYPNNEVPNLEERIRLQGSLTFSKLRAEFANETFLNYRKSNPPFLPIPDITPKSAWGLQWNLVDSENINLINRFDRAFLQLDLGDFRLIAGKQVIPIGVGQIFNAVSQIQRYPLIFIDPEFPKTEDAATLIWTGPFQIESRFLRRNPGQIQDNFHLRFKGTTSGLDWGLTSGVSDNKKFFGGESAFNLGDALMRFELVSYFSGKRHFAQGLLGFDYVFSPTWSTKFELFYNGFGEVPQNLFTGLFHRSAPFQGTWYAGNSTLWEIHPLLKAHLVSVFNLKDPSALLHLFFNYSLSDSLDLLAGQFLGIGKGHSEFGGQLSLAPGFSLGQSDISYAALRWYF